MMRCLCRYCRRPWRWFWYADETTAQWLWRVLCALIDRRR